MTVVFTKTMQKHIIGQRKTKTQAKKIDGFGYAFMTTMQADLIDWQTAKRIILAVIDDVMMINSTRDMELELDIPSGQYSVRFTTAKELPAPAYAAEIGKNDDGIYAVGIELSDLEDIE